MSTDTAAIDPQRLEELAAQVAELSEAQRRRDAEDERAVDALNPQAPMPSELAKTLGSAQDAARRVRAEAHAEVDRAYAEQVANAAPERERLEKRLRELAERTNAENERHAKVLAPIATERQEIRQQLDGLMRPRATYEAALATPERRAEMKRINEELKSFLTPASRGMALI